MRIGKALITITLHRGVLAHRYTLETIHKVLISLVSTSFLI